MELDVYVADEQNDVPVDLDRVLALARAVLSGEPLRGPVETSILFVDELAISALHEEFMGLSGPTDVLSFPIEDDPIPPGRSPDGGGSGPGAHPEPEMLTLLGDVVICPSVAKKNAAEHGVGVEDEIALLTIHGLLHLLGMDHEIDAEAEVMEAKERALLIAHYSSDAADALRPKAAPMDKESPL